MSYSLFICLQQELRHHLDSGIVQTHSQSSDHSFYTLTHWFCLGHALEQKQTVQIKHLVTEIIACLSLCDVIN